MTRRGVLVGSAAAVLAGCSARGSRLPRPDPDRDLTETVAAAERTLLARCDATLARHPGLASRLRPIREAHAAHLTALRAGPAAVATPGPVAGVPAKPAAALASLAASERAAARARVADCAVARAGDLARLLAAIGASEAAHAAVLRP